MPPKPNRHADTSSLPTIPGYKAEPHLANALRREVANLLGRTQLGFPGAQPVSFCRRHIEALKTQDYYLCEKSDGIRCLMYFTLDDVGKEIHYLIDRKNEYYFINELHFPLPNDPSFQSFHTETIIDGELVLDTTSSGKTILKYLMFDCLVIDGKNLMERPLDKRLAYFREFVYGPYTQLCRTYPSEIVYFPFRLEFKKMEFSYAVEIVIRKVLPSLPHGNDGLIFTCRTTPYKCGTDQNILKWKPIEENSIDFRLNIEFPLVAISDDEEDGETGGESLVPDYDALPTFNLSVSHGEGRYEKWGEMYVTEEECEEFKRLNEPLDEEIVECRLDEQKRWRFMRFRRDKKDANHISTVHSVIESINDAVGEDELIKSWKEVREAWKKRNPTKPGEKG
ncbi:mRNA capping enzyme, catalytic domain-containing protein [Geopyxis carbonaria]|nr:mRNA capping enzyme, catalytic domain-containing protein [Geopyxis carbonaria]